MQTQVSGRARAKSTSRGRRLNALALLKQDHEKVSALLAKYEKGRMNDGAKQKLAHQICAELTIHAQIEEEIFYPRVQESVKGTEDMLAEARVEHETLKRLIGDIEGSEPGDENYDAYVKVLGEYVKHHVREEQNELFPKVRKSKLDIAELGEELMQRKEQLMAKQDGGMH